MTTEPSVSLNPVERIEILSLMDNYVDVLLGSTDVVTRPPLSTAEELPTDTLRAEHGLSMLVTVFRGEERRSILYDTGYNRDGVLHNLNFMERDLNEIEAIVLSHGHMDHTGSLYTVLDSIPRPIPLVVHPHAFLSPRYIEREDGKKLSFPRTLDKSRLMDKGVRIIESKTATTLTDNMIMVTGEVERVTDFEKGLPNALMEKDGRLVKDHIADDQTLVIHLDGKGLVVISGCAHAGIINTILYARKLTGTEKVHALFGGFHLSGPVFGLITEDTVSELKGIAPKILVPMHCTGWEAIHRFSEEFPAAFILNSVGSKYTL